MQQAEEQGARQSGDLAQGLHGGKKFPINFAERFAACFQIYIFETVCAAVRMDIFPLTTHLVEFLPESSLFPFLNNFFPSAFCVQVPSTFSLFSCYTQRWL
jgi:hypothetical protein